jgi:hypothetical protein
MKTAAGLISLDMLSGNLLKYGDVASSRSKEKQLELQQLK